MVTPATVATVSTETPRTGTAMPCPAMNDAPPRPPSSIHQRRSRAQGLPDPSGTPAPCEDTQGGEQDHDPADRERQDGGVDPGRDRR